MVQNGFADVYTRGALVGDDFLSSCVVLIGQTPGVGWGVVPAETGPIESVVPHPLEGGVVDPGFVYVHFPLAAFDDGDEAIASCALTFGTGEDGELVWPDTAVIRDLVPTGFREALSAEVAAAAVGPRPRPGRERVRGAGRGAGGEAAAAPPPPGAGRGAGRATIAGVAAQVGQLTDSIQGILASVSALGERMEHFERRVDPPLVDRGAPSAGVDLAALRAEAGGLAGLGALGPLGVVPGAAGRGAAGGAYSELLPAGSLARPSPEQLPLHLRRPPAASTASPPGLGDPRPSGSGDGELASAIRAQTAAIVALGRRRRTDHEEGDEDYDEEETRLPGARGASALHGLQTVLVRNPGYFTMGVAKSLLRSVVHHPGVTADPRPSARGYVAQEIGFGTHRTLGYLTWGLATVWDELREGRLANAHATVSLLLVAAEQCAVDDGRWPLAWLLSLPPEPPWTTMMRRRDAMPLRPFGRLADPRWVAAAAGYVRDMDKLNSVRKVAVGWPGEQGGAAEQVPKGAGRGQEAKGKGKDKNAAGA